MAYQFDGRIRFSEVGPDRRLTLVSLVDYFQDCSTFHSEACGNGIDCLDAYGCVWMILFWQIDILRMPLLGEHVITQTWPYGFQAFYGYRNFAMLDDDGNYLAKANSVWALIDVKSGRPIKVRKEVISGYEMEPRLEMEYLPRKIQLPGEGEQMEPFWVGRQHLDTNHHVNNGQYIYMAEEFLPEGFVTGRLCVEYRQQARLHDVIVPHVYREGNDGKNGDASKEAACAAEAAPARSRGTTENRCAIGDTLIVSLCDEAGVPYAIVKNERA
ncbi:MAG: thioesterase [Lachnospiraceae bacterium]|nr:thioesterase [Lachnospiraceae bacterium]